MEKGGSNQREWGEGERDEQRKEKNDTTIEFWNSKIMNNSQILGRLKPNIAKFEQIIIGRIYKKAEHETKIT